MKCDENMNVMVGAFGAVYQHVFSVGLGSETAARSTSCFAPSLICLTPPFLTLLLTEGDRGETFESEEWYVMLS